MIIELILEDDDPKDSNIIRFADYADRLGTKSKHNDPWQDSLVRLAGCDVINLAERRT